MIEYNASSFLSIVNFSYTSASTNHFILMFKSGN